MTEVTRCYVLTHGWLSPQQRGIQGAHAIAELMFKNGTNTLVSNWAAFDKTIVLLNAGSSKSLYEICNLLTRQNIFAWASFKEDVESLEGAMTAVAVVLPESFYADPEVGKDKDFPDQTFRDIYNKIKSCHLA